MPSTETGTSGLLLETLRPGSGSHASTSFFFLRENGPHFPAPPTAPLSSRGGRIRGAARSRRRARARRRWPRWRFLSSRASPTFRTSFTPTKTRSTRTVAGSHTPYFQARLSSPILLTARTAGRIFSVYRTAPGPPPSAAFPAPATRAQPGLGPRSCGWSTTHAGPRAPYPERCSKTFGGANQRSTAREGERKKTYSLDAARRALLDHFAARRRIDVRSAPRARQTIWQIVYPAAGESRRSSRSLFHAQRAAVLLRTCLASILRPQPTIAPYENRRRDNRFR